MAEITAEKLIAEAIKPISDLDVPHMLRDSIERQSRTLMCLASSLLHAGMSSDEVRGVIDQACCSYRDELVAAILTLREEHDLQ